MSHITVDSPTITQKWTQTNTVDVQQVKVDRVGWFEPTTSASQIALQGVYLTAIEREKVTSTAHSAINNIYSIRGAD